MKGTTELLRKLKVGKSLELSLGIQESKNLFVFAKRLNITIATRRNGNTVTVWRLK